MIGPGLRVVLVIAGVFGAGLVCGVFLERHHSVLPQPQIHSAAVAEHERALEELRVVVGLDDEQMEAVNRIIASHQRVVEMHWEQLRPEVQEAMQQVHHEIAEHLRPDQRERYHLWLQQQRERHRQMAGEAAVTHPTAGESSPESHPTEEHPRS